MAIRVLEQTTCYQCECELMAPKGDVHPLCSDCRDEHDRWFQAQLEAMN